MKWIDLKNGALFKLNRDLYAISVDEAKKYDCQLMTKEEVDSVVAIVYNKGTLLTLDSEQWTLECDGGTIGLDENEEVDTTLYIPL